MSYNIDDAIADLKTRSANKPVKLKLPDDDLLDAYEREIGMRFPRDYRRFLKEASDVFVGVLNPLVVTEGEDVTNELAVVLSEAREIGLPDNLLPICEDNGDYYCLTSDEKVCFWSHNGVTNEVWPDLATWIRKVWIEKG